MGRAAGGADLKHLLRTKAATKVIRVKSEMQVLSIITLPPYLKLLYLLYLCKSSSRR